MMEAESELIAGAITEYFRMGFGLFSFPNMPISLLEAVL